MKKETVIKGFIAENSLDTGAVYKYTEDGEVIEVTLSINLENGEMLHFYQTIEDVKLDRVDTLTKLQGVNVLINTFLKAIDDTMNPNTENVENKEEEVAEEIEIEEL